MSRLPWTPEDDAILRAEFPRRDVPLSVLAAHLHRTIKTLRWRARVLRVTRRPIGKTTYMDAKLKGLCTHCRKVPALADNNACTPCREANLTKRKIRYRQSQKPTTTRCGACREVGHTAPTCPRTD